MHSPQGDRSITCSIYKTMAIVTKVPINIPKLMTLLLGIETVISISLSVEFFIKDYIDKYTHRSKALLGEHSTDVKNRQIVVERVLQSVVASI